MSKNHSHKRIYQPTPLHLRILDRHGSVRQFCPKASITRPYLYRILRGDSRPSIDLASTMARLLGLTLDELLALLGPSNRPTASEATRAGIIKAQDRTAAA